MFRKISCVVELSDTVFHLLYYFFYLCLVEKTSGKSLNEENYKRLDSFGYMEM